MTLSSKWWRARKEALWDLAADNLPLYIYNEETLNETFFDFLSLDCIDSHFYPVNANSHADILNKAGDLGLSFLCRSKEELEKASKIRFNSTNQQILFIPGPQDLIDMESLEFNDFMVGIKETDNLKKYNTSISKRPVLICLSLDMNTDFSNPENLFQEIDHKIKSLERCGAFVKGLHIEVIYHEDHPVDINKIFNACKMIMDDRPDFSVLSLDDSIFDLFLGPNDLAKICDYARGLGNVKHRFPRQSLWFTQGQGLVARTGILLIEADDGWKEELEYLISLIPGGVFPGIFNFSKICESLTNRNEDNNKRPGPGDRSINDGDILLVTEMGARSINSVKNNIREHYLPSRRICQVKI